MFTGTYPTMASQLICEAPQVEEYETCMQRVPQLLRMRGKNSLTCCDGQQIVDYLLHQSPRAGHRH